MAINIPITQDTANPYSEADIRYNYYNLSQIIAASNEDPTGSGSTFPNQAQYYSSDGGNTWGQSSLPSVGSDIGQSDPGVDWTSDGTAWAVTIGIASSQGVRSFKSINAGKDWTFDSTLSGSQFDTDKPNLWIDHSATSPFQDNMYCLWHTTFDANSWVSVRQGPGGMWSAPLQLTGAETTGTSDGGDIKTNSHGDVFAFWPSSGPAAVGGTPGNQKIFMSKSTNGGTSFNALGASPIPIANTFGSFTIKIPAQDDRLANSGSIGCLIYLSGGAYRTSSVDMVYACWHDLSGESGCNAEADQPIGSASSTCKTRIWFALSSNGGAHWQAPVMINNQSSLNDQFFPRLAVDDTNGNLMIVYYDTVGDPNRVNTNIWMQCSTDNGSTWTNAVKITSASTEEATGDQDFGQQYGDYIGLTGYAGNFFACWTDRRNGGNEQIWGAPIAVPSSYFIVDKNTYGTDEVNDSPSYSNAFYVAVEGASPNSLGSAAPALSGPFNSIPTITQNTSGGPLPFPTYEDSSQRDTPQRIVFPYNLNFASGATIPPFPPVTTPPETLPYQLNASISFPGFAAHALQAIPTVFELVSGEDPYFTNVDPSADNQFYLSQDLRVFTLTPGIAGENNAFSGPTPFTPTVAGGSPIAYTAQDPAAGYNYIQSLIGYLNTHFGDPTPSGTDPFALFPDQGNFLTADATVFPGTINPADLAHPWTNYNFAVARVRMVGHTGDTAAAVKVFFRLFIAQTYDTSYDTSTTYPSTPDTNSLPGSPLPGTGNETYPFFATGDYSPATIASDYGPGGANNQDITVGSSDAGGVWAYFGCYLNVYNSTIQGAVMAAGTHQCLVAQIAYDQAPIQNTGTVTFSPENSDKLAQRNMQISFSDNPGPASTHRIPQAFDTKPGHAIAPIVGNLLNYPDELMISWGNTPTGSVASIYWPQVDASTVLQLATRLYGTNPLSASDPHTLQCTVSDAVTYVPIPPGTGSNYAGLFTVNLPTTVHNGQEFNIVVRRIGTIRPNSPARGANSPVLGNNAVVTRRGGNWRYIVGTFAVRIPVGTKEVILGPEENTLAILKWRFERMALSNRWHPVLARLIGVVAGRILGMGKNPTLIPPSLTGYHPSGQGQGKGGEEHHHDYTGKVIGIVYDRFGDFEGFRLLTEEGHEVSFHGREEKVELLVYRAWEERFVIRVRVEGHDRHWPSSITYCRP